MEVSLRKLSRDELRKRVRSLKIFSSAEISKMKKSELLKALVPEENATDIFPFHDSMFLNYQRYKNVLKETVYKNEEETERLYTFIEAIRDTLLSDILDKNLKIVFSLEIDFENTSQNDRGNENFIEKYY